MPALPNVTKCVRLSCVHVYGGDTDVVSRFYVAYTGTVPSVGDLQVLVDNTVAAWADVMPGVMTSEVALSRVDGVDLNSATGAEATFADTVDGSRTGDPLPADASAVTAYHISRRYRGGHARGYWPMGSSTDLASPQTWDAGAITAFQGAIDSFMAAVLAGGWSGAGTLTHVNVSFYEGFTVVTDPVTGRARNRPTPRAVPIKDLVTANLVRTRIGSQRRRLGR